MIFGVLIIGTFNRCFAAAGDGSVGDTNIKYFGRWDKNNAAVYHGYWGGAYFRVKFTGTTVKINLGNTLKYHVKIDNNPWVTFTAVNGTNNLTATPLAQGTHTLIVVQGQDYSYDFAFKGLSMDPGAKTVAPDVRTNLIEWIGDSITDGYTDSMSDVSDYAWVCSETLGCEHVQIAYPGIALVDGYGVNTIKTGTNTQYYKLQDISYSNAPDWDFSTYTPKIVVINIGTNDGNTPNDLYQSTYLAFLGKIRDRFPDAHIVVLVPHTGAHKAQDSAAYFAQVAAGDTKVHFINASGWLQASDENDGLHPSDAGHAKFARLLEPLLAPYLAPALPSYTCKMTNETMTIDGVLNEKIWGMVDTMKMVDNLTGNPPLQVTRAMATWDSVNLYIAYIANDIDIKGTMTVHDQPLYNEEIVGAFIDVDGDLNTADELEWNCLGTSRDTVLPGWTHVWNAAGMKCAVKLRGTPNNMNDVDTSWTCEVAIPWKSLDTNMTKRVSLPPKSNGQMRGNFYRVDNRRISPIIKDMSAFSPTMNSDLHTSSRFCTILFSTSVPSDAQPMERNASRSDFAQGLSVKAISAEGAGVARIEYSVFQRSDVSIVISNVSGQVLKTLKCGCQNPGVHQAMWRQTGTPGNQFGSAVYFIAVHAGKDTKTCLFHRNRF